MTAPARAAELGVELVGDDLELLHRLERDARLAAGPGAAVVVVVRGAVDGHVVRPRRCCPLTMIVSLPRLVRGPELHPRQQRDGGEVAPVAGREVGQVARGDRAPHLGRRQVDERRLAGDRHRLLDGANLHHDVEVERPPDADRELGPLEGAEAGKLRGDREGARKQLAHEVAAVSGRDHLAERAVVLVRDQEGHPRQGGPLLIHDAAAQLRAALLGEDCGSRGAKNCDGDADD